MHQKHFPPHCTLNCCPLKVKHFCTICLGFAVSKPFLLVFQLCYTTWVHLVLKHAGCVCVCSGQSVALKTPLYFIRGRISLPGVSANCLWDCVRDCFTHNFWMYLLVSMSNYLPFLKVLQCEEEGAAGKGSYRLTATPYTHPRCVAWGVGEVEEWRGEVEPGKGCVCSKRRCFNLILLLITQLIFLKLSLFCLWL